ncbi:hypothetical protein [Streptomyces brevispora]|uniref:hypothetical protein n=1 Tax=Streptomyces brevispora TaxID=887462 RepID=UPI003826319C
MQEQRGVAARGEADGVLGAGQRAGHGRPFGPYGGLGSGGFGQQWDPTGPVLRTVWGYAVGRQLLHDARPVLERYARLYADDPGAASGTLGNKTPRAVAPAPDVLRDLYVDQRLSLNALRDITGASITVLRKALSSAGIEIRKQGHRPGYPYRIERDWLYEQYVVQHRTFSDIAGEIGVVSTTVLNIARRHNIPIRSALGVPRDFAATTQGLVIPPVVYRAFSGSKSVRRLMKISLLLDQPAPETAAEVANVRPSEWNRIAAIIERDTGIPMLEAANPPRLTAAGRTLLQQIMPILHRYDARAGSASVP